MTIARDFERSVEQIGKKTDRLFTRAKLPHGNPRTVRKLRDFEIGLLRGYVKLVDKVRR